MIIIVFHAIILQSIDHSIHPSIHPILGIGLALCKQLCKDYGARVYLGARNQERGQLAVLEVQQHDQEGNGSVERLLLDVASDESVQAAARQLTEKG